SSLSSTARVALMMPAPTSTISTASLSCCVINAFSRITALNCRDRSTRPRKTHQPDDQERSMCLYRCSGTCAREQTTEAVCQLSKGRLLASFLSLRSVRSGLGPVLDGGRCEENDCESCCQACPSRRGFVTP